MKLRLLLALAPIAACTGSGDSGPDPILPDVSAATFVTSVTNPLLPMPIGASWVIEAQTDEGLERIEILVLTSAKTIQGVAATVVRDTAYLEGVMIEDTIDWYAQDTDGNVWYLGEETCEYENGVCVSTEGSWEWGVDGAMPGIVMKGTPVVDGIPYYQEYYPGHAEDYGEILATGLSVTVPAGSFTGCLETFDGSTLEPLDEHKFFCPGVGLVKVEEGADSEALVSYDMP